MSALHILWIVFAAFFFVLALWAKMEELSKRKRTKQKEGAGRILKQGIFIAICVAISIGIDVTFFADLVDSFRPDWVPLDLFRFLLFPFILLLAAKVTGGSKEVRITKAPKVNK